MKNVDTFERWGEMTHRTNERLITFVCQGNARWRHRITVNEGILFSFPLSVNQQAFTECLEAIVCLLSIDSLGKDFIFDLLCKKTGQSICLFHLRYRNVTVIFLINSFHNRLIQSFKEKSHLYAATKPCPLTLIERVEKSKKKKKKKYSADFLFVSWKLLFFSPLCLIWWSSRRFW